MTMRRRDSDKAVSIIADAGGQLVGRTRLQKIAVLLELAGEGEGFDFGYRHYGPYSEPLAMAAHDAVALGKMSETERTAQWGGRYSIFSTEVPKSNHSHGREALIEKTKSADAIVLELAATAAFLASKGEKDPWGKTAEYKPSKAADGKLDQAKCLFQTLLEIETHSPLPKI